MNAGRMTWRRVCSLGLRAGLRWPDLGRMPPGLVCDLFIYAQRYDDEQHGVRRKKEKIFD